MMLKFGVILAFLMAALPVGAKDLYVAANQVSTGSGTGCSTAKSVSWFNNITSWGSGTTQIGLSLGYFALTSPRDCQIVQNFRQVRAGNHVGPQGVLESSKHFRGAVWLAEEQVADTCSKNCFRVPVM